MTTARIFIALLPKLRERGIRTLGRGRAGLPRADRRARHGSIAPAGSSRRGARRTEAESHARRIDTYPYRHRVRDVMRSPAKFIGAGRGARRSTRARWRASSLFALRATGGPAASADTPRVDRDRDRARCAARAGASRAARRSRGRSSSSMSSPLAAVPADAFVYRAIAPHEPARYPASRRYRRSGAISSARCRRAICLRVRAAEAVALGDEIDEAVDVPSAGARLGKAAACRCGAAGRRASPARDIAAVISRELGALTRRAAVIAERAHGATRAGCSRRQRYALAVLGSAGRGESLLAMDQDNALVFAEGAPGRRRRTAGLRRCASTSPTSCTRWACPIAGAA